MAQLRVIPTQRLRFDLLQRARWQDFSGITRLENDQVIPSDHPYNQVISCTKHKNSTIWSVLAWIVHMCPQPVLVMAPCTSAFNDRATPFFGWRGTLHLSYSDRSARILALGSPLRSSAVRLSIFSSESKLSKYTLCNVVAEEKGRSFRTSCSGLSPPPICSPARLTMALWTCWAKLTLFLKPIGSTCEAK